MDLDTLDEDLIIHLLNNLPSSYDVQVSNLEDSLGSKD